MNQLLIEEYQNIFKKYAVSIEAINKKDSKFSKIFLPTISDDMKMPKRVMFIGRETRGWGVNKNWEDIERNNVKDLMRMYQEDYYNLRESSKGLSERSRGVSGFLKRVQKTGIFPLWTNYYCVDYQGGNPYKQSEINAIKKLSHEFLSAQIKIFKPQYIIIGYGRGIDADRGELMKLLSHCGSVVSEEHYKNLIKKSYIGQKVLEDGTTLLDLYYHPAARVKGAGKIRKKVLSSI